MNADLIRCVAVYSVSSVHFLLNSGFYSQPVEGIPMLVMCMYRSCFMVCVPLFLLLTGYLMWEKQLTGKYYRGILKTVEIYVLVSLITLLYKKFAQGKDMTVGSAILDILDYKAAGYAWYIEMYFGLFLIIPFLNGAYHSLSTKRGKQILVVTMISLTMLPKMLNNFNFTTDGWWASPSLSESYNGLVPGFFTAMYPLTYYFIGAYLREYGCSLRRWKNVLLFLFAVAAFGAYNFYRSDGQDFVWGSNNTWGGENLITAVLLFIFLMNLHPDRWKSWIQAALVQISKVSLALYLLSWIFDQEIYSVFKALVPEVQARWKYVIPVVPSVFLCSFLAAFVLYRVRDLLHEAVHFRKTQIDSFPKKRP